MDNDIELIMDRYQASRDFFIVLDTELRATLVKGYGTNSPGSTFPAVIAAVNEILVTPVETSTWGRLKKRFQ
jgi:hypothetical protein